MLDMRKAISIDFDSTLYATNFVNAFKREFEWSINHEEIEVVNSVYVITIIFLNARKDLIYEVEHWIHVYK
jgi:hypothetical protein